MFLVAEDVAGLKAAAAELLEESIGAQDRERAMRAAERSANPHEALERMQPARSFAVGYYMWLDYVARNVEPLLQSGIRLDESNLSAEEVSTLAVLREARTEFSRNHPPCRGCGTPLQNSWDKLCSECAAAARAKGKSD